MAKIHAVSVFFRGTHLVCFKVVSGLLPTFTGVMFIAMAIGVFSRNGE